MVVEKSEKTEDDKREGRSIRRVKKSSVLFHVCFIAVATVAAVTVTIYYGRREYQDSLQLLTAEFNHQQLILARSVAKGVETFFKDIDSDLVAFSNISAVQRMEPGMVEQMRSLYMGFPSQASSRRLDVNGILRFIYPDEGWRKDLIGRDYSNEVYFRKDERKVVVSGLVTNEAGERRMRVARPVYVDREEGGREFNGVMVLSFDPQSLTELFVDPIVSGRTGYAWVLNDEGVILAHHEKAFVGRDAFKVRVERNPDLSYDMINRIQQEMMTGKEGTGRYISGWHRKESGKIEKLIAFTPIHVFERIWSVAVCVPVSEVERIVKDTYRKEMYALGSIICIVVAGGLFAIGMIYRWGRSWGEEADMRMRSEEALQRSERKFRDLAENTTDWVWEVDTQGAFTYSNPKIEDVLGYDVTHIFGKTLFDLLNESDRKETLRFFTKKALRKEPFLRQETLNHIKDGHPVVLEASGIPIFDETGQLRGYRGITREITERSQMLQALRESEEKFRVISEGSADGILVIGIKTGQIVYANPAICNLLGYTADELQNMTVLDISPKESLRGVMSGLEGLMSAEISQIEALPCLRKDGGTFFADVNSKKIVYEGRDRVVGFFRDITERKLMHEALEESEALHRLIVETMSDGLGILDENGIFTYINDKFFEILGYSRHDMIGRPIFDFFDETNKRKMEEHWAGRMERGHPAYEIVWRGNNGREIPTILSPAPILDVDGNFKSSLTVITDITVHKQDREKIQQSLRQLGKAMNSTIQAMAKMVEMRDPYTSGHQVRVARLACAIAKELSLPEEKIKGLYMASVIHDIGKIAVPAAILSRPGHQSESEINIIKDHPQVGYDILKNIEFPWPVAQMVVQHHERMDGSGYPRGLSGEEIMLEARILGVADVVESISSHRPYRPALGMDKALEEILKNKGVLYDSAVVDACVRLYVQKGFEISEDHEDMEGIVW